MSQENLSSGVCDQLRLKLACSATEAVYSHEIANIETRNILLCRQRTTKALIRLPCCAGWYGPLLFAYGIRQVFSWRSSYIWVQLATCFSYSFVHMFVSVNCTLHPYSQVCNQAAPVAEWLRMLVFRALNHSSSHCSGFETSLCHMWDKL